MEQVLHLVYEKDPSGLVPLGESASWANVVLQSGRPTGGEGGCGALLLARETYAPVGRANWGQGDAKRSLKGSTNIL